MSWIYFWNFLKNRDVLIEGGNAVDAAIAAMFCTGTVHPQTSGIGGGAFMTIYDPVTKTSYTLDSREIAPLAATENMFNGNSSISQKGKNPRMIIF